MNDALAHWKQTNQYKTSSFGIDWEVCYTLETWGGGRVEKHTSGMQRVITEYDTYRRRGACEHLQGVEYMFISSCLTTGAAGESL